MNIRQRKIRKKQVDRKLDRKDIKMDYFLLFGTWETIQYLEKGRAGAGAGAKAGEVKNKYDRWEDIQYAPCFTYDLAMRSGEIGFVKSIYTYVWSSSFLYGLRVIQMNVVIENQIEWWQEHRYECGELESMVFKTKRDFKMVIIWKIILWRISSR